MTASNHHANKGFTLLEVMIAVSITSIILIPLFRMQAENIKLATTIKFQSTALSLSKQLLIKIEQDPLNWPEMNGNFGPAYPGLEWTCNISKNPLEDIGFQNFNHQYHLVRIEMEVHDQGGQKAFKTTTWRFASE